MTLTGTSLLVLVALTAVAVFALLVAFWPRLAGATVGQVAARVVLLVLVNFLVLLTATVMLNDNYLFYASWGDLRGALTGTVNTTNLDRGASSAVPADTRVPGHRAVTGAAADPATKVPTLPNFSVPGYRVVTYRVHGQASGITNTVVVELPPGYLKPVNRNRATPCSRRSPATPARRTSGAVPWGWAARSRTRSRSDTCVSR